MSTVASRIVIVGLGPGDPDLRTLGAQRVLDAADAIILRTRVHPGLDDLLTDPRVTSCDDLYQRFERFDDVYAAIAGRVVERATLGGTVVFAVPGHPRLAELSVSRIEALARERGISIDVLGAVSFFDAVVSAANVDVLQHGLQIVDAEHIAATLDQNPFASGLLGIDPARPLLVAQVYSPAVSQAVKLALSRVYPDEHPVTVVQSAGIDGQEKVTAIALHALDRERPDHLTSLIVPPLAPLDAARSPDTLSRIVARLRAPGGCPWDREQTHASLRNAVLEEAYETVDAIDEEDQAGLAEELGDLLLLVMMHAQLAEEEGDFQIEDVYEAINRKLIRRHPHVFGAVEAETPGAVIATWEGVKAAERAANKSSNSERRIDRLPRSMPATRKVIEFLAPHATFAEAGEDHEGDELLVAISSLIERGIDPELALEASLRRRADEMDHVQLVAPVPKPRQGKGSA